MSDTVTTSELSTPYDPLKDQPGENVPPHLADVIVFVRLLLEYGLHLSATIEARSKLRTFGTIARFFGTPRLPVILARVARGILRVMALERVLLARARRGRELVCYKPRESRAGKTRPAADRKPSEKPETFRRTRRPDPDAVPDPDNLPTLEQLEAEIRRRPIGRALADICRDLAVAPGMCQWYFGSQLYLMITWYRGNLPQLTKQFDRRKLAYAEETDYNRDLDQPNKTLDGVRRILGFLIGEVPVCPGPLSGLPTLAAPPTLAAAARPP